MDHLSAVQISEWEAYDRIDPIGTWRDDFRMAHIISMMVNTAIGVHGKKGTKLTTPNDFMPKWDRSAGEEVKKQTPEEMIAIFKAIAIPNNKRVARDKKLGIKPTKRNKSQT